MIRYEKKYHLRASDFDRRNNLFPHAILDLFQDIAGLHAAALNIGYEDLIAKDLIWVLVRSRFEVLGEIPFLGEVMVETWPHAPGKVDFDRDYRIYDEKGNLCVRGSSKWCVCNYKTRKISLGTAVSYGDDEYCEDKVYPEGIGKVKEFSEEGLPAESGEISYCDLDHNGHANNTKYAVYILDSLRKKESRPLKEFAIDYVREMKEGQKFSLYSEREGNTYFYKCLGGEQFFRAAVTVAEE